MDNQKKAEDKESHLPIFMSLGMSVGLAIGAAMDNIPIGMCIGLGAGVGIGALLDSMSCKASDADEQEKEQ